MPGKYEVAISANFATNLLNAYNYYRTTAKGKNPDWTANVVITTALTR